jgi:formylmethanofuran dehydrogenase subunit E
VKYAVSHLGGWKRRSRRKECEADISRKWRKNNPEEAKRRKKQWAINNPEKVYRMGQRHGWKSLGLDPDDIEKKLSNHKGGCEICGKPPGIYEKLSVDHSHITKKFRGFLCYRCNLGIGQFNDDPDLLIKASKYLIQHNQEVFDILAPIQTLNS